MAANSNHPYFRTDIDSELLIALVKARPVLYDRSLKDYNNRDLRPGLWQEITSILFKDAWEQMTDVQREVKATEVLKRWNNLRTSFTRELKVMRDPSITKRKQYIYFDKLLFLMDDTTDHVFQTTEKCETSDQEEDKRPERKLVRKSVSKVKYKTKDDDLEQRREKKRDRREQSTEEYMEYSLKQLKEDILLKSKDGGSSKTYKNDGDTNFVLSLLPGLRMIPLDKKIDAQIEILSVIKKYRDSNTINYSIKFERPDPLTSGDDSEVMLSGDDDDDDDDN